MCHQPKSRKLMLFLKKGDCLMIRKTDTGIAKRSTVISVRDNK